VEEFRRPAHRYFQVGLERTATSAAERSALSVAVALIAFRRSVASPRVLRETSVDKRLRTTAFSRWLVVCVCG